MIVIFFAVFIFLWAGLTYGFKTTLKLIGFIGFIVGFICLCNLIYSVYNSAGFRGVAIFGLFIAIPVICLYIGLVDNEVIDYNEVIDKNRELRYEIQQKFNSGNHYATLEYLKKSLMKGENAELYHTLGYMYENGYGTAKDYNKAMKCYQKANAWREIGYMHYFGYGVYKDKDRANEYFAKCNDREDCKQIISYFERIANNSNDANALYNLGWHYTVGKGVYQDYQKALYYYQKAANLGVIGAYNNLGVMYGSGKGVERDDYTARSYYQKAADLGDKVACDNLGNYYENGRGGGVDKYKALKYYKKACDLGNQKGCENFKRLKKEMGIRNDDDVLF